MDGTDVNIALQEAMKREWNDDVDKGDGELGKLRIEYEGRVSASEDLKMRKCGLEDVEKALLSIDGYLNSDVQSIPCRRASEGG